jgi:proteasome accessory factor B
MARKQGAHNQAIRLIRILDQLQGHRVGVRLVDLEEAYGISRSQLRRDLLALEEAGIRLEAEQEHGRYGHTKVRIADTGSAKIELNLSERYTLLAARDFFRFFTGASLHSDMETIVDKVVATMPVSTKRHTRSMERKIHFRPQGGTKTYEGKEDVLNALLTGVLFERYVHFTYKPRSGRQTEGTFAPYAMVIHRNGLYVVAQRIQEPGKRQQKPRVFAVERFITADWVRRKHFTIPEDFDVEDHFDDSFGLITGKKTYNVVVDLAPAVRADAEARRWHREQEVTRLPNGGVRVQFPITSLREVIAWVLEWGTDAKVIEPPELRQRVIDELRGSLDQYAE